MGTPLGPKYIPYTYMDPLGHVACYSTHRVATLSQTNMENQKGSTQTTVFGLGGLYYQLPVCPGPEP